MHGMNCLNAFHCDDNGVFHDQVNPVSQFDFLSVIDYGQADLAGHIQPALSQFMLKAGLIGAFEESRAEQRMNMHGSGDNSACNLVDPEITNGNQRCHFKGISHCRCLPL